MNWDRFLELTLATAGSLLLAYSLAIVCWPLLTARRMKVVSICVASAQVLVALVIPADQIGWRAFVMFVSVDLLLKMIDVACNHRDDETFRDYLRFLIPFPVLLVTRSLPVRTCSSIDYGSELLRTLSAVVTIAAAVALTFVANRFAAVRSSFLLDHAIKLVLFVVAVEALSRLFHRLERLAGLEIKLFINSAYRSRTVGEFWCRYNTRVHAWLDQNVFCPAGGIKSPVRSVILVFFVSAILHEVGFGIATSRFDGYQFFFFMSQAPAALLSARLKQMARSWGSMGRVLLHATTIAWFAVSSIFFFHGVDRVFPFLYVSQPWLP